jgi:hypothetical protein
VSTVNVRRITLVVDDRWFQAIGQLHSYTEWGEVFYWHETSNPYRWWIEDEDDEYTVEFKGDKNHEAWAVIDSAGEEVEPSYWYDSREEAMKAAQERNQE